MKIGFFDSGFGGLDVLREVVAQLPEYDYVYLGDTARNPYGSRPKEEVYKFTEQGVEFLINQGSKLIIIACNTASSDALCRIQQEFLPRNYPDKKVLGVLIPGAEVAVESTHNKHIGVIATESTVMSGAFVRELTKLDSTIQVYQKACPLLVQVVEEGKEDQQETKGIVRDYLIPWAQESGIDTLVLGCTHFAILERAIQEVVGRHISIISETKILPAKIRDYLNRHSEIESKLTKQGRLDFYTTDTTDKFQILGSKLFGCQIHPKRVTFS